MNDKKKKESNKETNKEIKEERDEGKKLNRRKTGFVRLREIAASEHVGS